MSDGAYVGIDLGTTFSAVAHIDESRRPKCVQNAEGSFTTPSVVLFEDLYKAVVGQYAKSDAVRMPDRVIECIKRKMGRQDFDFTFDGRRMYPETISALVLKKLNQDAERRIGPIAGAVITVPAYFDDVRRTATYNAGVIAGLKVTNIINEPTAAALAYGNRADCEMQMAMVYDLGGGTFDVTVVSIEEEEIRALATGGDVSLGGKDWDDELIEFVASECRSDPRIRMDPRDDRDTYQDLVDNVVEAKEQLSFRDSVAVRVRCGAHSHTVKLTRQKFEELTFALLGQTQITTELVLEDAWHKGAPMTWDRLHRILLVGGSTRMPMVRNMLDQISGKPPDCSLEPDEVVAWGAAIHANVLRGDKRYRPKRAGFTDVNSHSLGVAAYDPQTGERRNIILIPANTPLPAFKQGSFKVRGDGARKIAVEVLEGEAHRADDAASVAKCYMKNLPAGLPKGTPVEVAYGYRPDGRIEVNAIIPGLDVRASMEITRAGGLTDDQIAEEKDYVERVEVS